MMFRRSYAKYLTPLASALLLLAASPATAVTEFKAEQKPFTYKISSLSGDLQLQPKDDVETIKIPLGILQQRLSEAPGDETVEPLSVLLGTSDTQITAMAEKLALQGKEDTLAAYLKRQIRRVPAEPGETGRTVVLNRDAFALIDHDAFADLYAKPHHNLTIATDGLKSDRKMRSELMRQVSPFFALAARRKLQSKINRGAPLDVNTDLLPEFARSMVKKFIVYRGPNCFHAALAFQSPLLTSSSLINVKRETGYHRAMINYDELWRVLNQEFYEVSAETQPLKYGDMMVLFDVPEDYDQHPSQPPDFHWIRHTATYLFDGYTFSKGSKSPNTPYSVRTLEEEWKTWKRFTKNLGMKVFRRSLKTVQPRPPTDQADWIY